MRKLDFLQPGNTLKHYNGNQGTIMPIKTYLLAFTIPISILIAFEIQGPFSFFAVIYAFGILPILELLLPVVRKNPETENGFATSSLWYDFLLRIMVPIQLGILYFFFNLVSDPALATNVKVGLTFSMGMGCGVLGINVAHELGHRKSRLDRVLARILLSTSLYWQFYIEHNRGHHLNVSTPKDPESSRLNESLYAFWFRAIKDTFFMAFRIDRQEMVLALIFQSFAIVFIAWHWGLPAVIAFLGCALIGILLLQSVNYIEHYGLTRKELESGQFEKVHPMHSWNADHFLSRAILFDLSRHSDHHAHVTRKYYELRHHPESPQMPTGYPGMILLALVPPLWFGVMNPRVKNWIVE